MTLIHNRQYGPRVSVPWAAESASNTPTKTLLSVKPLAIMFIHQSSVTLVNGSLSPPPCPWGAAANSSSLEMLIQRIVRKKSGFFLLLEWGRSGGHTGPGTELVEQEERKQMS